MTLTIMCGWCGKHLSGPKTDDQNQVSHGICKKCRRAMDAEIAKLKTEKGKSNTQVVL